MTNPILHANNATLGYPGYPVIEDFSGDIEAGAFLGIFGPNGAGKTTLLQCLLGLIKPLKGSLTVLGETPHSGNAQIGYVPQALPKLNIPISGRALLQSTVKGTRFGLPLLSPNEKAQIEHAIELMGAQGYADRPFMSLSGGEKRRLLIAQALLGNPIILLLDEPLANVDPHYQNTLVELLDDVRREQNITVLLTAHDINPLIKVMTKILYLAEKKAVIGTVDEVITSNTLTQLYGTPIEVIRHDGRLFVMHSTTGKTENVVCHH